LRKAFAATPERFVRGLPKPPALRRGVWINKPRRTGDAAPTPVPCDLPCVNSPARQVYAAPEGVAQPARRAGAGGADPPINVSEQARELHTKF
jgi:hypothetical protein